MLYNIIHNTHLSLSLSLSLYIYMHIIINIMNDNDHEARLVRYIILYSYYTDITNDSARAPAHAGVAR